jgi:hypothetical protein
MMQIESFEGKNQKFLLSPEYFIGYVCCRIKTHLRAEIDSIDSVTCLLSLNYEAVIRNV